MTNNFKSSAAYHASPTIPMENCFVEFVNSTGRNIECFWKIDLDGRLMRRPLKAGLSLKTNIYITDLWFFCDATTGDLMLTDNDYIFYPQRFLTQNPISLNDSYGISRKTIFVKMPPTTLVSLCARSFTEDLAKMPLEQARLAIESFRIPATLKEELKRCFEAISLRTILPESAIEVNYDCKSSKIHVQI